MYKPFKPPLLKSVHKSASGGAEGSDADELFRSAKRRRVEDVIKESPPRESARPTTSSAASAPRKPLFIINNALKPNISSELDSGHPEGYYIVLWRKFTAKKHKTWDGDGVLSVQGGYAALQDITGRALGKCPFNNPLLPGSTLSIAGKEVEVDSIIPKAEFLSGRPFIGAGAGCQITSPKALQSKTSKLSTIEGTVKPAEPKISCPTPVSEIASASFYSTKKKSTPTMSQYKNPMLSSTVMPKTKDGMPTPRHDPNATRALVMKRPTDCPKGKQLVDVVVDPILGDQLYEYQREGIKFLYECVMGLRSFNGQGAVLADEMGLGKTLQTIALLWTLLKQNPIHGNEGVIKKALIVCPVTLITNWKKEFNKWLGNERIGVFVANGQNIRITDFTHGRSYSVMIIGYERLRSVQDDLKKGAAIDIVIADEGHRLKTASNKSAQAILSLNTSRRIILSGTPLQNDLSELYTMVDFVNPGTFGTYNAFRREFEAPILKSRQPGASKKDVEKGSARAEELAALTKMFILRRTAEVAAASLPPKNEYVLFCAPTDVQTQVYHHVLASPMFGAVLGNSEASLQLITILKKVCNTPRLLLQNDPTATPSASVSALLDCIPAELLQKSNLSASTKFRVLDSMLKYLSTSTSEKIVIVSNYTSTLDQIGGHLASMGLSFLRLDGSTPTSKRQDLIDSFNRSPASKTFAFLLSAKSGGAGINLIGASRLVLFDVDWNPATDLQAQARIHRYGQKRPVRIYRLLMAGGMDEKIYQRQVTKMGLADSIIDDKQNGGSFSAEELRDLFKLDLNAGCQTHTLLGCPCNGDGTDLTTNIDMESAKPEDEAESDGDLESVDSAAMALMSASKVDMVAQEARILERQQTSKARKMQVLMQYRHLNTSAFRGETKDVFGYENENIKDLKLELNDEILTRALESKRSKVCFVFMKSGKGASK